MEGLENSKYVLLKNQGDLTEGQLYKLEEVKSESSVLAEMHELKEEFRTIFEGSRNWSEGTLKLLDWLCSAKNKLSDACKTIINWFGEVTAYFECHVTNDCVEGINNKLYAKLINICIIGSGYSNFAKKLWVDFCKLTIVGSIITKKNNVLSRLPYLFSEPYVFLSAFQVVSSTAMDLGNPSKSSS